MPVLGIGVDLVSLKRISKTYERFGEKFLNRILTEGEKEYLRRRKKSIHHLASRFAAKEAVYKSLGHFLPFGIRWKEIEIKREGSGPPSVILHGLTRKKAGEWGVKRVHISITHDNDTCICFAIAEG